MGLTNSKRLIFTANHVTTKLDDEDRQIISGEPEGALRKLNFVRAMNITRDEALRLLSREADPHDATAQVTRRRL